MNESQSGGSWTSECPAHCGDPRGAADNIHPLQLQAGEGKLQPWLFTENVSATPFRRLVFHTLHLCIFMSLFCCQTVNASVGNAACHRRYHFIRPPPVGCRLRQTNHFCLFDVYGRTAVFVAVRAEVVGLNLSTGCLLLLSET